MRAIVLSVLILAGCIPSLHEIYTEDDVVFDPALVGTWNQADGQGRWEFSRSGEKAYRLVHSDKDGRKGAFVVHLVKIGDLRFLDLYPEDPKLELNELYQFHLLPAHTFMHVPQVEPTLKLSVLNPEWLEKLLEQDPDAIRHEKVKDRLVLTASTAELQAFLTRHHATEDAFADPLELTRAQE